MKFMSKHGVWSVCIVICLWAFGAQAQDQSSDGGLLTTYCWSPIAVNRNGKCVDRYGYEASTFKLDTKGLLECDGDRCCGYTGKLEYDSRKKSINGTDGYADFEDVIDLEGAQVAAKGTCSRGRANGTWTGEYFRQTSPLRELEDYEEYDANATFEKVAEISGRYQFGLPVGGHTITSNGVVMAAVCFARRRVVEDGKVRYVGRKVWSLKNETSTGEDLVKPTKPKLEDFMPEQEAPIMEEVEKPDRSDYYDARDYREAMRDYRFEVKEAKAAFRESQREFKAVYKANLPEAKAALRAAMKAYKAEVKRYKAELNTMRAYGRQLKKLAAACPRATNDFCKVSGVCALEARCQYDKKIRAEQDQALDPEAGHNYDDPSRDPRMDPTLPCVLSKTAHCRQSDLCKEKGHCTFKNNQCRAQKNADCKRSARCKESGECEFHLDDCVTKKVKDDFNTVLKLATDTSKAVCLCQSQDCAQKLMASANSQAIRSNEPTAIELSVLTPLVTQTKTCVNNLVQKAKASAPTAQGGTKSTQAKTENPTESSANSPQSKGIASKDQPATVASDGKTPPTEKGATAAVGAKDTLLASLERFETRILRARVDGFCKRDDIVSSISSRIRSLKRCYEKALRGNPELGGKVTFQWTISPKGRVIRGSAKVATSTLDSTKATSCMLRVISRIRFAKPTQGGQCKVSYPFVFNSSL